MELSLEAVARFAGSNVCLCCDPGAHAPGPGSPAEHLGWGGRLYAVVRFADSLRVTVKAKFEGRILRLDSNDAEL